MTSTDAWSEVGDRVYVRRYRTWHGDPFDQNVGAVLGADGVVAIDTRASHRLADELREDLRALTRSQVIAVVNTHHHWDHTWGNARFSDIPTWGHVRCAERVVADSEAIRRMIIADEPALADELSEVVFTPPDLTFDETTSLDLGDRQLDLRYLGLGHTDNDIVITVPDASVLFGGDLIENDAPPSFGDAFPIAWAATVRRLAALDAATAVPGHGSVGDRRWVERQVAEFATLAELGHRVAAGEIDDEAAIRRSPFPAEPTRMALGRARTELAGGGLAGGAH